MLKVLSFRINNKLFGIETRFVKEINRNVEFTVVPTASEDIAGLLNLRGQVVTLFNLAYKFGYQKELSSEQKMCIVLKGVQSNQNQVGLLIDKTEDVFDVKEEDCENLPANTQEAEQKYVNIVAKLENELLMIVDPDCIVNE